MKIGTLVGRTYRPPARTNLRALAVTAAFSIVAVGLIWFANNECIQLVVWSSNEKFGLVQAIASDYNDTAPTVNRRCVRVTVVQMASGDGELALVRNWEAEPSRPDVWWPAAKTWVLLLRQHRMEQNLPEIVPASTQSLINSPLVIAMPQQMADTLTRSAKPSWAEISRLAQDPQGWALYGKSWGRFRLGKTNPMISTSGLHALIGTYNAAAGKLDPLTLDDIRRRDVRDFVQSVESSVVHYGESVGTFLKNLWNADAAGNGLGYVSAIAVEEKQVFDYNRGNPGSLYCDSGCYKLAPKEKLVALYLKEGTLIADHPYVVLTWADLARQQAALDFQTYLGSDAIQDRFLNEGFRDQYLRPGLALQKPYFDPSQPATIVRPPDQSVLAEVQKSWSGLRKHANVLIEIDVARSMGQVVPDEGATKLDLAKRAASDALALLEDGDQVGLWTFSITPERDRYREVMPISLLGPNRVELARRINGLGVEDGRRQLFATILAGVNHVRERLATDRINAVVVLSDGIDEGTRPTASDLESTLRGQPDDARVRVFTVAYSSASSDPLRRIAEASPGAFYDATDPPRAPIKKVLRDVLSNF